VNLASLPTLYSVFNYKTGLYDYYEPAVPPELPASGTLRAARGKTPESLAAVLPEDAKLVGSGEEARGIIAAAGSSALGEAVSIHHLPSWVSMFVGVGTLYFAWRMLHEQRARRRKP